MEVTAFYNLILEVLFQHLCYLLFIRSELIGLGNTLREGTSLVMRTSRWGSLGGILEVCLA